MGTRVHTNTEYQSHVNLFSPTGWILEQPQKFWEKKIHVIDFLIVVKILFSVFLDSE